MLTEDQLGRSEDRRERERTSITEVFGRSRDDEAKSERKKTTEHLEPDGSVANNGVYVYKLNAFYVSPSMKIDCYAQKGVKNF